MPARLPLQSLAVRLQQWLACRTARAMRTVRCYSAQQCWDAGPDDMKKLRIFRSNCWLAALEMLQSDPPLGRGDHSVRPDSLTLSSDHFREAYVPLSGDSVPHRHDR